MVFPSLFFQNDPGLVSQASGLVVLAFSFLLHRFKKRGILVIALITLVLVFLCLVPKIEFN